jgi:hypothetical protein
MPVNMLIVEDLFIEADDLRIILQKAGLLEADSLRRSLNNKKNDMARLRVLRIPEL